MRTMHASVLRTRATSRAIFRGGHIRPDVDEFGIISKRTALRLVRSRNLYERRVGFKALEHDSDELRKLACTNPYPSIRREAVRILNERRDEDKLEFLSQRARYQDTKDLAAAALLDIKGAIARRSVVQSAMICRALGLIE